MGCLGDILNSETLHSSFMTGEKTDVSVVFQHELIAPLPMRTREGQYSWTSQPPAGRRDVTHVAVWEVAIATVCYKLAIGVNDIPKDTPLESPKPRSGSVSVRISTGEDLNLHPVNK